MLTYTLEKQKKESLYEQLYRFIREDILSGRLHSGERLPSKRTLAQHLEVSTITVKNAYEQLQAEGYIHARQRCGDFVSEMLSATSSLICTILQLSLSRLIHSGYFSAAAAVKYAFSPNAHPLLTASTASFAPSHTKYPVCLRYFLCSVSLRYSFIYVFCLDVISIFLLNTQFLDFYVSLC